MHHRVRNEAFEDQEYDTAYFGPEKWETDQYDLSPRTIKMVLRGRDGQPEGCLRVGDTHRKFNLNSRSVGFMIGDHFHKNAKPGRRLAHAGTEFRSAYMGEATRIGVVKRLRGPEYKDERPYKTGLLLLAAAEVCSYPKKFGDFMPERIDFLCAVMHKKLWETMVHSREIETHPLASSAEEEEEFAKAGLEARYWSVGASEQKLRLALKQYDRVCNFGEGPDPYVAPLPPDEPPPKRSGMGLGLSLGGLE
jgi:hypothetical protein